MDNLEEEQLLIDDDSDFTPLSVRKVSDSALISPRTQNPYTAFSTFKEQSFNLNLNATNEYFVTEQPENVHKSKSKFKRRVHCRSQVEMSPSSSL